MQSQNPSASWGASVAIVVAGLVVAGAYFFSQSSWRAARLVAEHQATATPSVAGTEAPRVAVTIDADDPILGNPTAPVTVIVFTDFQCPYCREFHQTTFQQLKQAYVDNGQAAIVFKDFPLSQIHPRAEAAAIAAHCAHEQHLFWPYADQLFHGTQTFDENFLLDTARATNLELEPFTNCLAQPAPKAKIAHNVRAAIAAGITATPAFVINGQLFEGALPYDLLATAIDNALP